jgi:hypothetical protein
MWITSAGRDIAHGFRVLRPAPALFGSSVLVLGITAGAMISAVVLADRLLIKSLSICNPDRLIQLLRPAKPGGYVQETFPARFIEQMRDPVMKLGTPLSIGYRKG